MLTALGLAFLAAGPTVTHAVTPASTEVAGKVDPLVLRQVEGGAQATFWAVLEAKADLSQAHVVRHWADRGAPVMDALQRTADASQANLRSWLSARGVRHQSFWVVNAVRITAGIEVLERVAARPEVARVLPSRAYRVSRTTPGRSERTTGPVEWGIDRIGADDAWAAFGARGQRITVASIDTGVLYTHPALVRQYRGNRGEAFQHDYNWWDPANVCGSPLSSPCDNIGIGTHTMGTMVGDDGAGNQIGVAPRARWIAAKGCEAAFCSDLALVSSGQWVLAPTDLRGENPRPGLRPHVVSSSWDGEPDDPLFRPIVRAWVAAGIFPVFAVGANGPSCDSVGAPASYPNSYGVGAFDMNNVIASFSGRGPSPFGNATKPDIGAPGVNIRSSYNDGGYSILSGTSMATPHLSGTVALIWSEVPSLKGDVRGTLPFIDDTAVDTAGACGGTLDDNNTWGEGRLDAFAAVDAANGPSTP